METSSSDPSTTVADTYSDIIYEAFRKFPLNLADNCCVLSIPTITSTRDLQRSQSRCEEPSKVQEKRS
ncbi:hypothetical protein HUJ05_002182 [Dendroctonus ponderosae]|nr:hypothetical protein HUJ05_002182 [Dendroctonus ponderosae]